MGGAIVKANVNLESILRDEYVSGGYTVSTLTKEVDCSGTRLRRTTLASSHTQRRFFPDDWAIEWVSMSVEDRRAHAKHIGLDSDGVDAAVAWATEQFDVEFGAWNVCYTLDTARAVARRFFSAPAQILGLGLHRSLADAFIRASAPPPTEPGKAPMGAAGAHVAVSRKVALHAAGCHLGFEVLVFDGAFNSLESLHLDEGDLLRETGIATNAHGLVPDFASALRLGKATDAVEGTQWLPWLITEYDLQA